jgi:hypothetical protein
VSVLLSLAGLKLYPIAHLPMAVFFYRYQRHMKLHFPHA